MSMFQWSEGKERSLMAIKSHERTYAVLFDMLEKKFTHFTRFEWFCQVNEWACELKTNGYDVNREVDEYEEVLSIIGSEEWFVTFIED